MASIKLPDGSVREVPDGTTVGDFAASIGRGLAKAAIVGRVDGKLVDLSFPLSGSHEVAIVTDRDPDGLYVMRHSTAHVLAQALRRLYGVNVQYTIGPVIENGFFYDFEFPKGVTLSAEDLPKVEAEMAKIVAEDLKFSREDVEPDRAKSVLHDQSQRFKDEIIDELVCAGEQSVSLYRQGDFTDLCRGPHVPSTGKIKAFKLMSTAGAYWRGDSSREQLTRVYGTAFFDKKELEAHLKQIEEAKQRDHRLIGQRLGLFAIDDQVGPGLILWKPKGATVRLELQKFLSEELFRRRYEMVFTPNIGKIDLYKTSGHYPYYEESQFPVMMFPRDSAYDLLKALSRWKDDGAALDPEQEKALVAQAGIDAKAYPWDERDVGRRFAVARQLSLTDEGYLLKPMNCPHHIKIYASEPRSYRDLPIRLAEFGTVYRNEKTGELNGLTRVRGFTQDDAHIFCTHEQVKEEFRSTIELVQFVFKTFGFQDVSIRLSLRDPASDKYVGAPEVWDVAEAELRDVLQGMGADFTEAKGEAAFYGPKVDFMVRDVIGRRWQLGTVQLDYNLPERFKLEYTGPDNKPHRPVMIHRAPFGSMERFMGILIEHFNGAFPLWLAPVQVQVLTVSEKSAAYGKEVVENLRNVGLRAEGSLGPDKIGAKIREATLNKVPYMLVVGEQEAAARKVAVRHRTEGDKGQLALDEFVQKCVAEVASRGQAATVAEGDKAP